MGGIVSLWQKNEYKELMKNFSWQEFKDASVSGPQSQEVLDQLLKILDGKEATLDKIRNYKQAADDIRNAMRTPSSLLELKAFEKVKANAAIMYEFYLTSRELKEVVPRAIQAIGRIFKAGAAPAGEHPLVVEARIFEKLAEILDYVLCFDELKMQRPGVQNDFSYYRRALSKKEIIECMDERDIDSEAASQISLFIAQHTPFMTAVEQEVTAVYNESDNENGNVNDVLAAFTNACWALLKYRKIPETEPEKQKLFLRAMVGGVVLYDHVEPEGSFIARSLIQMREVCDILHSDWKNEYYHKACDSAEITKMKNVILFTTTHISDLSTQKFVLVKLA
eukprot:243566_1